jgi:hypothetical protein
MGAFAAFIFAPILTKQLPQDGNRFQLVDIFSLVVLWTYPLALAQAIHKIESVQRDFQAPEYVALGLFEVVVTAVWIGLAGTLSYKGVNGGLPRFLVIAIGTPLGILATIGLAASTTATWAAVEDGDDLGLPVAVMASSLVGGAVSHVAMRWAISRRRPPVTSPANEHETPLNTSDRSR